MIHPVGGSYTAQEAQSTQQKSDAVESAPNTSAVTGFGGDRVNVSAEAKALALAENQAAERSGAGDLRNYGSAAKYVRNAATSTGYAARYEDARGNGAATRGEQVLADVAAEDVHGAAPKEA